MGTSVVALGDGPETLLSRCIPNLHLISTQESYYEHVIHAMWFFCKCIHFFYLNYIITRLRPHMVHGIHSRIIWNSSQCCGNLKIYSTYGSNTSFFVGDITIENQIHFDSLTAWFSTNLNSFSINVQSSNCEVYSYSVLLPFKKHSWLEAVDHTSLAHVGISNENDLEEEIKRVVLLQLHFYGLQSHGGQWCRFTLSIP